MILQIRICFRFFHPGIIVLNGHNRVFFCFFCAYLNLSATVPSALDDVASESPMLLEKVALVVLVVLAVMVPVLAEALQTVGRASEFNSPITARTVFVFRMTVSLFSVYL